MSDELTSRRGFIAASTTAASAMAFSAGAFAQSGDAIKVGLIGCGGRGTGAAHNILDAAAAAKIPIKIQTLGDVFDHRIAGCLDGLKKKDPGSVTATPDSCFVGFDAFKKVLATDIDLVLLATPPGFRPMHLEAAVEAGKNIFAEKPVAVDVTGIRKVLSLVEKAKAKKLAIVAGTQRRHQAGYQTLMKQVHDGAIGEITSARAYWNGGDIWFNPRKKGMSDVQYQLHNWYHFLWLCGDHIVEQHVHNLDVMNWALQGHPIKATGMGGRSNRRVGDPKDVGHIFDHFAVEYEYPNGLIVQSYCRQIDGTPGNVSEALVGTKGKTYSQPGQYSLNGKVTGGGDETDPYVQEHIDLLRSLKAGTPLNELENVATSTMTAILGRMATYSGKVLEWEKIMKTAKQDTFPKELSMDMDLPVSPTPVVGKTPVV